jgi:type IV secretion system protein VirD4
MDNMKQNSNLLRCLMDKVPHYEHMRLIDATSDDSNKGNDYIVSKIKKNHIGNVMSSYIDKKGKLHYVMDAMTHSVIVGGTGSGKSTGPISAQIDSATLARYPIVISDTKGELYANMASIIRSRGYDVLLINLKDPIHSERLNPLYKGAALTLSLKNVGEGVVCDTVEGGKVYIYKGVAYKTKKQLQEVFDYEVNSILNQVQREFREVIATLWPDDGRSQEIYWCNGARAIILAIALALSLDQLETNPNIRTDIKQVNFSNIKKIFDSLEFSYRGKSKAREFFARRGVESYVYTTVNRLIFENAETTVRNIISFVSDLFCKYDFPGFMELTVTNTFKMDDVVSRPTALFLVYDEMDNLSKSFVSYAISYLLSECKRIADSKLDLTLPQPILFIIDEFATLPENRDIANFFAFGRSRNVFLHIVLQSYSQLAKYGELGKSFLENSGTKIFLSTNDYKTIAEFSRELGLVTMISPGSDLDKGYFSLEERALVTCSELAIVEPWQVYVKRNGKYPIKGSFVPVFKCPELHGERVMLWDYPDPLADGRSEYTYDVTKISSRVIKINDDMF